jgi:hypothetical protein
MRKYIAFCLFGSMGLFLYPQEQNIYEEVINRDITIFIEEYKTVSDNILIPLTSPFTPCYCT